MKNTSFLLFIAFFLPRIYAIDMPGKTDESKVFEAYELRINGQADKAETMLLELLKQDSTDALAYFELARTKHHMFMGGTEFSQEAWKEVMYALQQAVQNDPNNKVFAFYYGYSCFFNAFISMMRQQTDASENVAKACEVFKSVLTLNPNCYEAMLYLIDLYGSLPVEMGGDKEKAGIFASQANKMNKLYGAMANDRLLPDSVDKVIYWQKIGKETGMNAQVLEELGRAYLLKSDTENGTKYFMEAIQKDNDRQHLYMHLVRYHILAIQQNPDTKAVHLVKATELVNSFMQSTPELVLPLKAYAYGILALINMINEDNNSSDEYKKLAEAQDPFYSKAMGMPPGMLYCRPDAVEIQYSSFFLPF
jgi:tetratricopeptide (TPR) repeat protein